MKATWIWLLGCLLAFGLSVYAQQSSAPAAAGSSIDRQHDAVPLLAKAIAAAGGNVVLSSINDITAHGTRISGDGKQVSAVDIRIKGEGSFRIDFRNFDDNHSLIANHGTATSVERTGTRTEPFTNTRHLHTLLLPILAGNAATMNGHTTVAREGTEEVDGIVAYKVSLTPSRGARFDSIQAIRTLERIDLLIDPATYLVVAMRDAYYPRSQRGYSLVRQVSYADFRDINGVPTPFKITERIGGQVVSIITLDSVAFNTNISDSEFKH